MQLLANAENNEETPDEIRHTDWQPKQNRVS